MLSDEYFLPSEAFSFLLEFIGQYVGLGIGLAFSLWMLGYIGAFVVDLMKGG